MRTRLSAFSPSWLFVITSYSIHYTKLYEGVTGIGSGRIEVFGHDNVRDYRLTRRLTGVMHQEIVIDNFFTIDQTLV